MKTALFVTYSYPPSRAPAAQRPFAFAKYLARRGWRVEVLAPREADSSLGFDSTTPQLEGVRLHLTENFEPFKTFRKTPSGGEVGGSAAKRRSGLKAKLLTQSKQFVRARVFHPDRARFWHRHAIKTGMEVVRRERPDVIFGTAPMFTNLWVARDLARATGTPWVADFRDLFAVMPHPTSKPNNFDRELERTAIEEAHAVTFISGSFKKIYGDAFPAQRDKMHVIYNGYDPEEFPNTDVPPLDAPLTIFYAGSLYGGHRDPLPLWRALARLKRDKGLTPAECRVEIAGPTDGLRGEEIAKLGIQDFVKTLGLLPRTETLRRMAQAHLLWLIVGHTTHHTAGVPLKLYEYMAVKRPVLAFVPHDTECAQIIERTRIGVVFGNDESETPRVAEALEDFLTKHKSGQRFGVETTEETLKFRRPDQAAQLEKIFLNVMETHTRRPASPIAAAVL